MNVYSVIGGIDYQGEDSRSLLLFDCKSAAEQYQNDLKESTNKSGFNSSFLCYDYVIVSEKEVIMKNAING